MEAILLFIIYLLAIYGTLTLILGIFGAIRTSLHLKGSKLKLVLVVKNSEKYIEFLVKDVILKFMSDRSIPIDALTVINMNSVDDTGAILEKLHKDVECLEVLSEKEKERVFCNF
ncbi:MAG: hypothetical protein FIA99_02910 [Ruminiclostridium sp.]|nr:hypothetical protein [Ruminiclostridium sp.]